MNGYLPNPERELGRSMTVTFDSTSRPDDPVVVAAVRAGWDVAYTSVTEREASNADFFVSLKIIAQVPEIGVWEESDWNRARWADEPGNDRLETILSIISNASIPKDRSRLSEGQKHQLRDAMILEAHVAAGRSVFVSKDERAFVRQGRRASLERLLQTRILTDSEFEAELLR